MDEVALIRDTISHYAPVLIAPLSIQIRRAGVQKKFEPERFREGLSQHFIHRRNDFRLKCACGKHDREAALLLFNLVHVTVSTICRISFVCAQARIETE